MGRHHVVETAGEALPVIQAYADRVAVLARDGARVVVLPEKLVGITSQYADSALAMLGQTARAHGVTIVAGLNLLGAPAPRNVAVVVGTDGAVALEYDKQHPVPGLEAGYHRGRRVGLVRGFAPVTGVAICKDLDFVSLGRDYARAGAGLLLVPAWNFVADGWLHSRMAEIRGVEGGFAVARAAAEGRLTISDALGRIIAERWSGEAAEVLLAASVAVGPGGTFFSRAGDWFAWLCLAMAVASVAITWQKRPMANP